jgi:hypothetical protein
MVCILDEDIRIRNVHLKIHRNSDLLTKRIIKYFNTLFCAVLMQSIFGVENPFIK